MNDPIISPWMIYLIETVESLTCFVRISGACALTVAFICFIDCTMTCDDERITKNSKKAKKFFVFGMVAVALGIFIPTRDTIYKMIAASYVTPANIQVTGELADKAVDKIIDKIADAIQKFERSERK